MRKRLGWIVPAGILGIAVFTAIGGGLVMYLWNWLLPTLFGLRAITFWQAIGLLALCRILFGGFGLGRGTHRYGWRRRMGERWEQMTPREREIFRYEFRRGCGPTPPPESTPSA